VKERLHKVLASYGIASRRRAEEMIASGEVTLNGTIAHVGDAADPEVDLIRVRGEMLGPRTANLYLALNKPRGYVTSLSSTHGERTVMELLTLPERVYPVGRLDKETSGLLLLTSDGEWANIVSHPRYRVEKEYRALVRGRPSAEALQRLHQGVVLPDGSCTAPAVVSVLDRQGANTCLAITVLEGKKRQIRLMAEAVGHPVLDLSRVRVGSIVLEGLREGAWRRLTDEEVESVRRYGREPVTARRG
jgi:23S rRNA pseudouridine2605 synthase